MRFLLFFGLLSLHHAHASEWSDSVKVSVDAKLQQHFLNKSQVGVVVGVAKENENFYWNYGERSLGSNEAPTADTFFEMGSITKTFTATLLAREILLGRVALSSTVKSMWPELSGTDAGEITLEQLATHHSGLPRMPENFVPTDPLDPYKNYSESMMLDFLRNFRQKKIGPYPYEYSNIGMGLLGHLLSAKLNHQTFESYIQENLLQPLGLFDTKIALSQNDLARGAQGYNSFFNLMPFWNLNVMAPAGALKTTTRDLLKFAQFNMNPPDTLLGRAATLAHQPLAESETPGFRVGLAWDSGKLGEHEVITHGGATGGYRANLIIDSAQQISAVILSNTDISPRCALAPIFAVECEVERWVTVSPEKLAPLPGKYFSQELEMKAEVSLENGILGLLLEDQPKLRLWPRSETSFFIPDAKASVEFQPGLIFNITQEGQSFEFRREGSAGVK